MIQVGGFAEFGGHTSPLASITTKLDPNMPQRLRGLVAMYLVQGGVLRYTMERLPDVLDGDEVYLSAGLRTDGEWFWRADLAHYVLKYGIQLPAAFLEHAERAGWTPKVLSDEERGRLAQQLRASDREGDQGSQSP